MTHLPPRSHRLARRLLSPTGIAALLLQLAWHVAPARADLTCPDHAGLELELRRLCDIAAAGIQRLPGEDRYVRTVVLEFRGSDQSPQTRRSRRMISDRLAVECLGRQHQFNVLPEVLPQPEDGSVAAIRARIGARAADVAITGELTRSPEGYAVGVRVLDLKGGGELTSAIRLLPGEPLDALSACIVEPRGGAALLRSALVPGWGQIFNGDTVEGALLITLEAGLLGGALASEVAGRNARQRYDFDRLQFVDDNAVAEDHFARRNLLLGVAGAFWIYGMVDAYLGAYSYTPDEVYRSRFRLMAGPSGASARWDF